MPHDFVSDQNPKHLPAIADIMPEWAKSASVITADDLRDLTPAGFADPVKRLHPIHTKVATYFSAAYLAASGVLPDAPEMQLVKSAAGLFGIAADVDAVVAKLNDFTKSAAVEDSDYKPDFALMVKMAAEDATPTGYYPLTSACQVQDSARDLANDYNLGKIPVEWYKDASVEVMKAANYFGLQPEEIFGAVRDMAVDREPDFKLAEQRIEMRKYAGVDEEGMQLYHDIIKSAASEKEIPVAKYVGLLEEVDRHHQIKYSGVQLNPWQVIHGGPATSDLMKMAKSHVICFNVMVPGDDFAAIPEKSVRMKMASATAEKAIEAVKLAATDAARASGLVGALPLTVQRDLLAIAVERGNQKLAA